jgi:hypothetical protein
LLGRRTTDALFLLGLLAVSWFICCAIASSTLPERWISEQSVPGEYEIRLDRRVFHSGRASGCIRSVAEDPKGCVKLMQSFSSAGLRGLRIRMSAYLKTQMAYGAAHIWLRADGPGGKVLALDDMNEKKVTGTTDLTKYDLALEVPHQTQMIACGVLMSGKGRIWVDDFSLQSADQEDSDATADVESLGFE